MDVFTDHIHGHHFSSWDSHEVVCKEHEESEENSCVFSKETRVLAAVAFSVTFSNFNYNSIRLSFQVEEKPTTKGHLRQLEI